MADTTELELEALKSDVRALRTALETARAEAANAEQRAGAEHQSVIVDLRATITALRDQMTQQREELLAAVQAVERDGAAEAEQLRRAVIAARRHADETQQQHDGALARQSQQFDTERRELHDTITELRLRLETTESSTPR